MKNRPRGRFPAGIVGGREERAGGQQEGCRGPDFPALPKIFIWTGVMLNSKGGVLDEMDEEVLEELEAELATGSAPSRQASSQNSSAALK